MPMSCIVCDKPLREEAPGITNYQPRDGVYATIPGNYGSTRWDPFDGSQLQVYICDACLDRASRNEQVMFDHQRRPVRWNGFQIGWEETPQPLRLWNPDARGYTPDSALYVTDEDLAGTLPDTVTIDPTALANARLAYNHEEN